MRSADVSNLSPQMKMIEIGLRLVQIAQESQAQKRTNQDKFDEYDKTIYGIYNLKAREKSCTFQFYQASSWGRS
jgi:hypothetical protein